MNASADDQPLLEQPLALLDQRFAQRCVALPSGAHVAVREGGAASGAAAVVLLHGISSGSASWLDVALQIKEQRVIAWDAPGYGDSTPLASPAPTDTDYAARLDELLRALNIQCCVLVGHSLGALMACAHVREFGAGRVQGLVLISPAGGYGAPEQAETAMHVRRERREALAAQGVAGLAERIAGRLLSPAASVAARAWVRWNTARLHPQGYLQAVELLCGSSLHASRGRLALPLQVHVGDADVVTPPAACRAWAEALAAPFALIENAGHASPVEQPEAVARLITRACGTEEGWRHV